MVAFMLRALVLLLLWLAPPALAGPELCDSAARTAAAEHGVPVELMLAITLAESGRAQGGRLRPWPWAANLDGAGHWFDSRAELVAFAEGAVAAGRSSLDIGCFQINWRWHGQHFTRPADLADPLTGARHAARFLSSLRAELGSWDAATGAYHSRTPALAARYAARVAALRGTALRTATPPPPEAEAAPAARGGWSMPAAGPPAAPASLVPAAALPRPFLTGLAR